MSKIRSYLPGWLPNIWYGYVLFFIVGFTVITGMTILSIILLVIIFLDKVFFHTRYFLLLAKGQELILLRDYEREAQLLQEEVSRQQQMFMMKKQQEIEGNDN